MHDYYHIQCKFLAHDPRIPQSVSTSSGYGEFIPEDSRHESSTAAASSDTTVVDMSMAFMYVES